MIDDSQTTDTSLISSEFSQTLQEAFMSDETARKPDWAISFFNEGFPSTKEMDEYYMFRDHDLVWLMRGQGDNCHFVCGYDGRHFSQKEFQSAFLRERKKFNDDRISKAQALTIGARLKESWCIHWHSPFEIPLPGDAGSGHE